MSGVEIDSVGRHACVLFALPSASMVHAKRLSRRSISGD
jgi:hypothetical protein